MKSVQQPIWILQNKIVLNFMYILLLRIMEVELHYSRADNSLSSKLLFPHLVRKFVGENICRSWNCSNILYWDGFM